VFGGGSFGPEQAAMARMLKAQTPGRLPTPWPRVKMIAPRNAICESPGHPVIYWPYSPERERGGDGRLTGTLIAPRRYC
jgi:hypothetical protein